MSLLALFGSVPLGDALQLEGVGAAPLTNPVVRLVLAALLGLFLGLEREWSEKTAGIRTFSLTSLVAAVFTLVAVEYPFGIVLLGVGGVLVIVQGILLAVQGLRREGEDALSLTTAVSLMAAYGVGALVASGEVLAGVTVAVVSSMLLVLKRELHSLAGRLDRQELRSTTEFAILAFVAYPLLPAGPVTVLGVDFEPRVAWLMVVTVAGIGIVNYAVVQQYGGRGVAVTGFFGGLASSSAVVGTMLDHVKQQPDARMYGVAAVLLADAAMALRNLAIALAFTFPDQTLVGVLVPLGALVVGSVAAAWYVTDWRQQVDIPLESPFSLRNALAFGLVFLFILVGGTAAQSEFGTYGLYVSALLSGFVSSAGATTTAVLLYRGGTIGTAPAVVSILLATAASVGVKVFLAATGPRAFARSVTGWSVGLLAGAGALTGVVVWAGAI
ncbi:MgtC/SapB family protein [Halopelagius fulvigenes]|uniref:MgtC/SapB family protein n=1 Tax=Halopelagius fulvigenes TaxID=1198324 RepID=A0ABD5TYK3_9EURY